MENVFLMVVVVLQKKITKPDFYNIDGWFERKITCLKCGWEGSNDELN